MRESDLLSYIGAVTGIIGALTGIAGAVMGYYSYRKTNEMKSLELRMELMKAGIEVFQQVEDLGCLLTKAQRSREAVAAATGMLGSGAYERWKRQFKVDENALTSFNEMIDEYNIDYSSASITDLERRNVEFHSLRTIIKGISDRYQSSLVEDDSQRARIQDRVNARPSS